MQSLLYVIYKLINRVFRRWNACTACMDFSFDWSLCIDHICLSPNWATKRLPSILPSDLLGYNVRFLRSLIPREEVCQECHSPLGDPLQISNKAMIMKPCQNNHIDVENITTAAIRDRFKEMGVATRGTQKSCNKSLKMECWFIYRGNYSLLSSNAINTQIVNKRG